MDIYEKLKSLGIELPPVVTPAAAYVPCAQAGKLLFVSGHIARKEGGKPWVGQFGKDMQTEDGKTAARRIAIDLLGTLHAAVGDSEPDQAHRQAHEPGQFDPGFHRATRRHERRERAVRRSVSARPSAPMHAVRSASRRFRSAACVEIEMIAELA